MDLRIIQLVDTGLKWWNDACTVSSLCEAEMNPSFMDTVEAYASYLKSVPIKPDVILATGWPVTITIVREALKRIGEKISIVGYPHMTLQEGEKTGVGGVLCLNDADVVFSISKQIDTEIQNSGLSVKTIRVNNGITFPEVSGNRDAVLKERKLLYIGRLVDGKNLSVVFRAMANTKDEWFLRIVGQGELEKTKEEALSFGVLDHVEFCGFKQNPYENTEEFSFCIIPSNYEGFCLVIPEALSRGIPVISTPVGCATEVIRPGENGYLVNVDDSEMLTQILDYVSDGSLPVPKAEICRASVLNYEIEHAFEKWHEAILEAIKICGE